MFEPERHAAVTSTPWDPDQVRQAIQAIVSDAEARFDPVRFWPAHPLDDHVPDGSTGLYFGAAGMIWAMQLLQQEGAAKHPLAFGPILSQLLKANRAEFVTIAKQSGIEPQRCSYLFGDAPILLMMLPDPAAADQLFNRIEGSSKLPVLELMWGAAGTMIACAVAHARTGEDRWRTLYLAQAARLLAGLDQTALGPVWNQDLYGQVRRYLGPVHGYAGNMRALLAGWDWLTEAGRTRIREVVLETLTANALRSGDEVNWKPIASDDPVPQLVQYCHGAPGMVATLADPRLASPELTALMEGGGRLTWRAGPLAKGTNLCHGTGGNGFAFLKLHQLTGDPVWLDHARAFAMTAIEQWRAAKTEYGQGRFSLWTGDIGLACYLHECLAGSARFPTVDVF
jgi:uncharacterized membrane protein YsdA (DUF1294 family)